MQQRQPRLGDILDDYCPRERRLTNHAVVAMIGDDIKQTRCTTCDAEHAYKHAKIPRQRKKSEPAALYAQVLADASPKKVVHDVPMNELPEPDEPANNPVADHAPEAMAAEPADAAGQMDGDDDIAELPGEEDGEASNVEEGPVHRPLIRAQLPRTEGQPPPTRPAPEFTIRQPTGRPNRFRPRNQRGIQPFQGNRSGNSFGGGMRGGAPHPPGGRPPMTSRLARRQGPPRKRSK